MTIAILILAAGLGLFFAKRNGIVLPKDFPPDSEYSRRDEGEWTAYSVTPARAPLNVGFFIYIGALGLMLAAVFQFGFHTGAGGVLAAIPLIIALWWGLFRDARPKGFKNPGSFRVSSTKLEGGGRVFDRDEIHRIIAPNGLDTDKVIFATNSHSAAGAQMALNHQAKVQNYAYGVAVEAGGKRQLLAGGLTETTAFALVSDICAKLGFDLQG